MFVGLSTRILWICKKGSIYNFGEALMLIHKKPIDAPFCKPILMM